MNNKFGTKIFRYLNEGQSVDLKILFEEDVFDKMDKEEEPENPEETEDSEGTESPEDSEDSEGTEDPSTDSSAKGDESTQVSVKQFNDLVNHLGDIKNLIINTTDKKGTGGIESFIGSTVAKTMANSTKEMPDDEKIDDSVFEGSYKGVEKFLKKNSIENFLIKEEEGKISDDTLKDVEAEIDDLDRILNKGSELVDTFRKGHDIDIEAYVDAAINAYRNFDNLFSKEEIIKQATVNVIVLNSGSKAESNVKDFEELFHEELHKKFNVEYDEFALITKKHSTASGAKSQG